jgi:CubicO group peptidase (beta-lactamase class C family)
MTFLKILRTTLIGIAVLLGLLLFVLWVKPPDLLKVGANYSAKIVCSNVFLAGRDPQEVLRTDVQAPAIALLRLMRIAVDRQRHVVRAGLLGFIGDGLAVARPGYGCAAVPDGNLDFAVQTGRAAAAGAATATAETAPANAPGNAPVSAPVIDPGNPPVDVSGNARANAPPPPAALWPDGTAVTTSPAIDRLLADDKLAGPGMRAIVVVDHGRIVAERYAPGFSAATPLLGWSMTKSVVAGLVGLLVKDGALSLEQSGLWPSHSGDSRGHIRIADLLAMSSGLRFNEAYGVVSDITRMLYLEPDMAAFARDQPLLHPPGEFWSYSSGSANILSRIVQDAAGPLGAAFPKKRLFDPLGMTSATLETDDSGTLVGSSYMYATARDWARYGQFLLQQGVWQGREMLPPGYVAMMASPVAASHGQYGHGLVWLHREAGDRIPADSFWMEGHDGQSVAIIPSRALVIVRLGLTPSSDQYRPQPLTIAVLDAEKR